MISKLKIKDILIFTKTPCKMINVRLYSRDIQKKVLFEIEQA